MRRVIVRVIPAASAPAPSAPVTAAAPPTASPPVDQRPHRWSRRARARSGAALPRHRRRRGPRDGARGDMTFRSMGSDVRLLVGPPASPASCRRRRRPLAGRGDFVEDFARCLTRFDPSSELCALNRDRAPRGARLAAAARRRDGRPVGRAAAAVGSSIRRWSGRSSAPGTRARASGAVRRRWRRRSQQAPPRRPAAPDPARRVARSIEVDDRRGAGASPARASASTRAVSGKGLAADAVGVPARRLPAAGRGLRRRHRPPRRVGGRGGAPAHRRVRAHAAA